MMASAAVGMDNAAATASPCLPSRRRQGPSTPEGENVRHEAARQRQTGTPRRRRSVFKEVGLSIDGRDHLPPSEPSEKCDTTETLGSEEEDIEPSARRVAVPAKNGAAPSNAPLSSLPRLSALGLLLMLCALIVPGLRSLGYGPARSGGFGVEAAAVHGRETRTEDGVLLPRQSSSSSDPSSICKRWAHQSAVVNGTLYLYGGRAMTDQDQTTNQWNNDFLSLPLDQNFQIGTPTLKSLPSPAGPPAVAQGVLWNSLTQLFLYGGEFSDSPTTSPSPFSTWEYDIPSSSWNEHENPKASGGNNSDPNSANQPVQRAAEGAGLSIPELGLGYYFGGHLDPYTTPGWQQWFPRVYLKSLLEFTFPGFSNTGVQFLSGGQKAGSDGVYRNITQGGLQTQGGFPERADGILIYVPGWGPQGIILGLAGGTNQSFTQMNIIDIYDIADSTWYKQATSGETPEARVNPCAVVAAAADGSSFNIHMYGGQNLVPYAQQIQYDDMWILSVPSFNWIKVDTSGQSNPPARAGHSCNVWNAQMIVVGGYVGQDLTCDSPGVYIFDMSTLKWQTQYTALKGGNDQNQQPAQTAGSADKNKQPGLSGSFGYQVPAAVQSVIGGHTDGGATVTAPVQSATEGPLATGTRPTFTVTQSGGAVVTETGAPGQTVPGATVQPGSGGPNVGAIVAGVVAGVFAIAAFYFAFCAWVYRRQLRLYKDHVAMAQRQAAGDESVREKNTLAAAGMFPHSSSSRDPTSTDTSSGQPSSQQTVGVNGYTSVPSQPSSGTPPGTTPGIAASEANTSNEDLMAGQEPSFLGVLLSPRRSLRVINRD